MCDLIRLSELKVEELEKPENLFLIADVPSVNVFVIGFGIDRDDHIIDGRRRRVRTVKRGDVLFVAINGGLLFAGRDLIRSG